MIILEPRDEKATQFERAKMINAKTDELVDARDDMNGENYPNTVRKYHVETAIFC
jgi:hypothetical protein